MTHRNVAVELLDAADIACGDHWCTGPRNIVQLALTQAVSHFRLQDVIDTGRPAAQMRLEGLPDLETRLAEKLHRQIVNLLTMLERTCRVIGDRPAAFRGLLDNRFERQIGNHLGDVTCQSRYLPCNRTQFRIIADHMGVILDHGAATRRVGNNRLHIAALEFFTPGQKRGANCLMCRLALADMMGKSPAA